MSSCPHCGAESREQALFCQQCGEPLSQSAPGAAEPESLVAAETVTQADVPKRDPRDIQAGRELPIPENIAAVIAYLTIFPAIVFAYVMPFRRSPFVRFHAFQHIFLFAAGVASAIAASILLNVLQLIPFMRVLIFPFIGLMGLAWFFLWLLLVTKAYHYEMFKLPWIGDLAEEWSRK